MKKPAFFVIFSFLIHCVFSQSPVVESGLIFPTQDKRIHGSTLVALPNGDYLAAWYYGRK